MMQICGGSVSRKLSQCLVCERMNGLIAGLLGNSRKLLKNFLCTMHFQFREHAISRFLTPLQSLPALPSPPHSPNIFTFHILFIRVYTVKTKYFVLNQVGFCDVQLFVFPKDKVAGVPYIPTSQSSSAPTSLSGCGPLHPPLLSPLPWPQVLAQLFPQDSCVQALASWVLHPPDSSSVQHVPL